jgi:hypothetical protein
MFKKSVIIPIGLLTLAGCAQQDASTGGLPWWGWLVLAVALIFIVYLVIVLFRPKSAEPALQVEEKAPVKKPDSMLQDDLTRIEGIGPKTQSVLLAKGIHTFGHLANMSPSEIKGIMDENGIRLAATDTWPEQARLASEGKFDELDAYQERLKGGRER